MNGHQPTGNKPFSDYIIFLKTKYYCYTSWYLPTLKFCTFLVNNTYMTEDIMASVEKLWKLIIWVAEILETIFPEAHVFKRAKRFVVGFDPVW